ncbi:bifunctional DNA-formamidopyrimidine glycosylase/DNA-(apurinic or apyrimidinic site) lyase [Tsukamurella sp. 8F]|uniref:bifunctional DNA-formamidopyrimidine glycosylase/DNA-(apurinic or apyrimidinic site) lyase n=1 Tax=unclassified Tsukamurella TaxID=2633480 RepID=UPI0023B97D6A|nr:MULTISPECIES: bifunctional DNA-formamidopyrimidine glycosylase/DNA-(apurinic or apyrimidinic site) lyase [unclassified Tsukamurella]MDF0531208.1 bifunctional DNA-formamidopyrimidine glycosylase/DNA-(apurinic or apyrimidinic site) lyase [Tsukamurella sp. 8J]MDF0588477.1 bifunctional DNA-formamidopyrimidine glycosylase/DNA-(apurinic or apyrimidinic site) lyase [Tsukamurella sp. 8F]
MPELPEVEVVRRGLADHLVGRTVVGVDVLHPRAARRHVAGDLDLIGRICGATIASAERRGKFLWLPLSSGGAAPDSAIVVHLGMSGQMLFGEGDDRHLRIRAALGDGTVLRFLDQRTFGGWHVDPLVMVDGTDVPTSVAHIARDPLDPLFDHAAAVAAMKRKDTEVKRVLLDQTVVSGIGNIYADEALWRSRVHGRRRAAAMTRPALARLLDDATQVMREALGQGGTSFDALYVNVNGQSGYFERSLNAYGRDGEPCRRCGTIMRREQFMNRGSHFCPRCQRAPRR